MDKAVVYMYEVLKLERKHNLSIKCLLSLFDKMVKPILCFTQFNKETITKLKK